MTETKNMSGRILTMDHMILQEPDAAEHQSFTVSIAQQLEDNNKCFAFFF